ncbi:MAG: DUF1593 domain-containing protein [Planctomycetota bacterium]
MSSTSAMRQRPGVLTLCVVGVLSASASGVESPNHRLVVLADMGNEPDEEQQMAHLLMYANEIDIEGLVAVTGKYLRRTPQPELFRRLVDGYAQIEDNLRLHAEGWPTADELRQVVASGQSNYGIDDVGEGKSSPGSMLLLQAALSEDPRPLHVVVNAGANTLAQALVDYRSTHGAEEVSRLVKKLRVFENGAQDNAGAWICHEFPDIHWIRSNFQTYCYGGPGHDGDPDNNNRMGPHTWHPYEYSPLGQHQWALEHVIAGHGALGSLFPLRLFRQGKIAFIEGGGTAPWMGLVQQGVYDPDQPHWGSYSGRFSQEKAKNVWSRHQDVRVDEQQYGDFFVFREVGDRWINPDTEELFENAYAPVWRWRRAMFNDFRARMDWCVRPRDTANHNPVAAIDGDASDEIVRRNVNAGDRIAISAVDCSDPDGDGVECTWYSYPEAGSYLGELSDERTAGASYEMSVPEDAAGSTIHLIMEVVDDDQECPLYDFRRIVIEVAD